MTFVKITREKPDKITQKSADMDFTRSAIIAESDAINLYESQIENTSDSYAKKIIEHVMNEEKDHLSHFSCLLMKQDPSQADKIKKDLRLKDIDISGLDCLNPES